MKNSSKTWIEAALNGPWGKARQPGIPVSVDDLIRDGIAAARAGAAIIHVHAYDEETGRQNDDAETYARIIEGIRAKTDVIVYPTLPLLGSGLTRTATSPKQRFAHVAELAARGLIDMTVIDPGSVNFTRIDAAGTDDPGFIYLNPEEHIVEGLALAATRGLTPSYAIYEPGFTRLGAALAAHFAGLPSPLYRFMFSDAFAWGFPPRRYALDAHLALLWEAAPGAPWMIAGLGVDIRGLVKDAVALGGHVRVGLEDAPFGCEMSNAELVTEAVDLVRAAGSEPATAAEVRLALTAAPVPVT
jgi:3-keto-5-aminohexanoate cleavage enzyme